MKLIYAEIQYKRCTWFQLVSSWLYDITSTLELQMIESARYLKNLEYFKCQLLTESVRYYYANLLLFYYCIL